MLEIAVHPVIIYLSAVKLLPSKVKTQGKSKDRRS